MDRDDVFDSRKRERHGRCRLIVGRLSGCSWSDRNVPTGPLFSVVGVWVTVHVMIPVNTVALELLPNAPADVRSLSSVQGEVFSKTVKEDAG